MVKSTITFTNGVTLPTIAVYSNSEYYQDAKRDVIEVRLPEDCITFEELQEICTPDNLETVILSELYFDDDGQTIVNKIDFPHSNYVLLIDLGKKNIDGSLVFVFRAAKRTDDEILQVEQLNIIDEQLNALLELAELV